MPTRVVCEIVVIPAGQVKSCGLSQTDWPKSISNGSNAWPNFGHWLKFGVFTVRLQETVFFGDYQDNADMAGRRRLSQ
ncbi:MAG: hypothetical protein RI953_3034 [Pseudomonadota bacterium]